MNLINQNTERLLTVYALRHMESEQNKQGYGEPDTNLTEPGKVVLHDFLNFVKSIGVDNIDEIMVGDLKRHKQTFNGLMDIINYKGKITSDKRLNALMDFSFISNSPRQTEEKYNLKRFKAGKDGFFHTELDGKSFSFDPVKMGIYPFDALYSATYIDKKLGQLVFPDDPELKSSFENVDNVIKSFQEHLVNKAVNTKKPLILLTIGSCSPNGFNLEYSEFGTIAENMTKNYDGNKIFPQDHDEIMVFGYSKKDKEQGKDRLHVVNGNIKIKKYLKKLR